MPRPFYQNPAAASAYEERSLLKELDRLDQQFRFALKASRPGLSPQVSEGSTPKAKRSATTLGSRGGFEPSEQDVLAARARSLADPFDVDAYIAENERRHASKYARQVAAIAEDLERQRRQSAPMSREAFLRAQAKAAARRRYIEATFLYRGVKYKFSNAYIQRLFGGTDPGVDATYDPCVDQVKRRQVMFAQRSNRGHRTKKSYQIGC